MRVSLHIEALCERGPAQQFSLFLLENFSYLSSASMLQPLSRDHRVSLPFSLEIPAYRSTNTSEWYAILRITFHFEIKGNVKSEDHLKISIYIWT